MKKALLFISIFALILAACNTRPQVQQAQAPAFDTAGLASFQEWKLMNERAELAKFQQQQTAVEEAAPVVYKTKAPVRKARKPAPVKRTPVETDNNGSNDNTGNGDVVNTGNTGSDNGNTGSTGDTQEPAQEKKGISNAAKGTVIGAAGGAVIGAVINKKNRVLGGVIGGVIGGGVGYGIGRKIDKKQEEASN